MNFPPLLSSPPQQLRLTSTAPHPWWSTSLWFPPAALRLLLVVSTLGLLQAHTLLLAQGHRVDTNQWVMRPYGPLPQTPAWPLRPLYGLNTDEFWIGASGGTAPPDNNWQTFWRWCDSMGIRIVESREDVRWKIADGNQPSAVDSMIDAAQGYDSALGGWRHRVIAAFPWLYHAGYGSEYVLFSFDSAQHYQWQHRFTDTAGGTITYNSNQPDNWNRGATEVVYDTANTSTNSVVLQGLVVGMDSLVHTRRWRAGLNDDQIYPRSIYFYKPSAIPNDQLINHSIPDMPTRDGIKVADRMIFITVRGHLFSNAVGQEGRGYGVGANDTLLELAIYEETQDSARYRPHLDSAMRRASGATSRLYKTLYITKSMIQPDTTGIGLSLTQADWDGYRDVSFAVDMVSDPVTRETGPWDTMKLDSAEDALGGVVHARDFDLRVRWTGKEKLALRSVILRDSLAQLVQQQGGQNDTLRKYGLLYAYRMLRGPTWHIDSAPPANDSILERHRRVIIRAYVGDEGPAPTASSFSWADSLLYRTFGSVVPDPDSLRRGLRGWHGANEDMQALLSSHDVMTPEVYISGIAGPDTAGQRYLYANWFGVDLADLPAIREHNGGRFYIPELALTDSAVRQATRLAQRYNFGHAVNLPQFWPHQFTNMTKLLYAARLSRATGRQIIMWPSSMRPLHLRNRRIDSTTVIRDTLLAPLNEGADYRTLVNCGLAYGARGMHYSYLGFSPNQYAEFDPEDDTIPGVVHYRLLGPDLGMAGMTTACDSINHFDLVLNTQWSVPVGRDTIRNLYTGWKNQTQAVKWINRVWIPGVWQYLKNLRWRESYSAHFAVRQKYGYFTNDTSGEGALAAEVYRPFPSSEIVQSVQTWDRYGNLDSLDETYVEVGLFDSVPGTAGYDTNYIFLTQRRTFERPADVSPDSSRGKTMDSLAEWRRVLVGLRLAPPDSGTYHYARIRELAADSTPAPWMTSPRTALDTVVNIDSAFALWMRPGGGALLQITYVMPGDTLNGVLAYNNSRKIIYANNRYWATFAEFDTYTNDTTSYNDRIWLAWSPPVDSVERAIRWGASGGGKYLLSGHTGGVTCNTERHQNRHPSITVREIGDSTLATVVWSCHPPPGHTGGGREIVARTAMVSPTGNIASISSIENVAFYNGSWLSPWGTPVTSTLDGAEAFVWSDSTVGIVGRLRTTGLGHLPCFPSQLWSNYDTLSKTVTCHFKPGKFPTMPALAHITSRDSNVGVAWEQPINCGFPFPSGTQIYYKRIVHTPGGGGGSPILSSQNDLQVTTVGAYQHPSLDLQQGVWFQAYESIAFEEPTTVFHWPIYYPARRLWYRPIYTETRLRWNGVDHWNPYWDSIEVSTGWTPYSHTISNPLWSYAPMWPNLAALNEVSVQADSLDTMRVAIAYRDDIFIASTLHQIRVWYGNSTAISGYPKQYSFSGYHPAVSASPIRQDLRAATLYEDNFDANTGNAPVSPTHQFFSRLARPRGYLAVGREIHLLDTAQAGVAAGMTDLWISDQDTAVALPMTARETTLRRVDTLSTAMALVKSAVFETHDSVVVGLHTSGSFTGDSAHAAATGMSVTLRWELLRGDSVIALLDSVTIDAGHPVHGSAVERTLDLVSGSYHVRMTADTTGVTPRALTMQESRWPVVETSVWVEELGAKMARKGDAEGARARLDVQPNPASERAEVLVSVVMDGPVRITLTGMDGRSAGVIYEGRLERGRYSVPVELTNLVPGSYLIEMTVGRERLVRKLVVR